MKHLIQKILKSLSLKKKKKGFSLIELMIVLAIIGFLTAMAVPNFLRFQLKSKQAEAKAQLGALYMAQKAFFAEWNGYYSDFRDIGYDPEGNLTYQIDLAMGTTTHMPAPNYTYSGGSCASMTVGSPPMTVFTCTPVNWSTSTFCPLMTTNCVQLSTAMAPGMVTPDVTQTAFTAGAGADLDNDGADIDSWSIDQNKTLLNPQSDL